MRFSGELLMAFVIISAYEKFPQAFLRDILLRQIIDDPWSTPRCLLLVCKQCSPETESVGVVLFSFSKEEIGSLFTIDLLPCHVLARERCKGLRSPTDSRWADKFCSSAVLSSEASFISFKKSMISVRSILRRESAFIRRTKCYNCSGIETISNYIYKCQTKILKHRLNNRKAKDHTVP